MDLGVGDTISAHSQPHTSQPILDLLTNLVRSLLAERLQADAESVVSLLLVGQPGDCLRGGEKGRDVDKLRGIGIGIAHNAFDGQTPLTPPKLDQDGRAQGNVIVSRRHPLRCECVLNTRVTRPFAIQQVKQVHALRLIVGASNHDPIPPFCLALRLPANGGPGFALGVCDARHIQCRINDVLIERAGPESDVGGDPRPVTLRHPGTHHVRQTEDQSEGKHAHGGGEHDQQRAELVAPQVPPDLAPDDAHCQQLPKGTQSGESGSRCNVAMDVLWLR